MNELQTILRLEGVTVKPPTNTERARVILGMVSDGGLTDSLLEFVGTCCGEAMAVRITPLRASDDLSTVDEWEGRCYIGNASVAPPGKDESIPRVKFSLIYYGRQQTQAEDDPRDDGARELILMRLAMMEQNSTKAEVRLALEQRRLDLMPEVAPESEGSAD